MNNKTNNNYDCSDIISIDIILQCLNSIEHNNKIYYHGLNINYDFSLNNAIDLCKINELEESISYKLPDDYKEFMLKSNGINLSNYARLFDIDTIYSYRKIFDCYSANMLLIGECYSGSAHILIELNSLNIYVLNDIIGDDYFQALNCNFTEFLNRFTITYGFDFWNWGGKISNYPKIDH